MGELDQLGSWMAHLCTHCLYQSPAHPNKFAHPLTHTHIPPPAPQVPIMSELGNVTPFLLVPGSWTEEELDHHAQALATAVNDNVSCNCIAAKVGWVGRRVAGLWLVCFGSLTVQLLAA